MKTLISKLNEIFDKSNNLYLRFIISVIVTLIPFLLFSIIILIAINNYLRAIVLILFLIVSFFEKTRDNKFVLGFIGIIPIGFYVVTSPLIAGWYLSNIAKDIGGIVLSNPVATIFSGISIYGIIKTLKGASSTYEWFMNSGLGGYFFPEYKNIKDQINLKNQAMVQMVKNYNDLLSLYESVKITKERWKTIAIGFYDKLMTQPNPPSLSQIESSPNENIKIDTNMSLPPVLIAVQENQSIEIIDEQMMNELEKDEEETKKRNNLTEKIMQSQQIITIQQQSTAIIPVSDATFTAVQKVLTGGALVFGGDTIIQFLLKDSSSFWVQGYNVFRNYLGPFLLPAGVAASIGMGELTSRTVESTTNIVKKTTNIITGAYRKTQKLVLKGIMNITENATSTNVPDVTTKPQIQFKDPKFGKVGNPTASIQDVSLVRKSGYKDFIDPNIYKPTIPSTPPSIPKPLPSLPKPYTKDHDITKDPQSWIS